MLDQPPRPELDAYRALAQSFVLHLEVRNRAKSTITIYLDAVHRLGNFLADHDMPTTVEAIERQHVEAFIRSLLETRSPGTALNRFKSLQAFFKWCVEEEEVAVSPMARMRQPFVPDDNPPGVLSVDDLRALLKACDGRDFTDRRDRALILTLLDTGMRRGEAAGMQLGDVDLAERTVKVTGKGSRVRVLPLGAKSTQALDRYLRTRVSHRLAPIDSAFWLSRDKALTVWGIGDVIERRANEAGIGHVTPHQFRHTFAHIWRVSGGDDDSLMRLAGWRSREMLARYGRSAADERAREAHKRLSPGDSL